MRTIRNIGMSVLMAALLFGVFLPSAISQTTEIVSDAEDDVLIISYDLLGESEATTPQKTSEKPNLDITKITYLRNDDTETNVTLILAVNSAGYIENKNDLEDFYNSEDVENMTSFEGSAISYQITLKTNTEAGENLYSVSYSNGNCTFDEFDSIDYTIVDNELTVEINLESNYETFKSISAVAIEMNFSVNLLTGSGSYGFVLDAAPDSSLFMVSTGGPYTAKAGDPIYFVGNYEDSLEVTQGPYTYEWDFDDATTSTELETTHTYQLPGTYFVTLRIEDSQGLFSEETTMVTITTAQPSDGNNTNGDTNGDSNNDISGLLMFIAVIVVFAIIGVIALIFVIRR